MGEHKDTLFRSTFNRSVGVEESTSALTGDTGALLLREMAERLGLREPVGELIDHRDGDKITHPLYELMLSRVLLIAQGLHRRGRRGSRGWTTGECGSE